MDAKTTTLHWKHGRWYRFGDVELTIVKSTKHGHVLYRRPFVDIDEPEGVECESKMGSLPSPNPETKMN